MGKVRNRSCFGKGVGSECNVDMMLGCFQGWGNRMMKKHQLHWQCHCLFGHNSEIKHERQRQQHHLTNSSNKLMNKPTAPAASAALVSTPSLSLQQEQEQEHHQEVKMTSSPSQLSPPPSPQLKTGINKWRSIKS